MIIIWSNFDWCDNHLLILLMNTSVYLTRKTIS